jgi:hypothetical protein
MNVSLLLAAALAVAFAAGRLRKLIRAHRRRAWKETEYS